jgi:putrescine transport system substrate-binding protein
MMIRGGLAVWCFALAIAGGCAKIQHPPEADVLNLYNWADYIGYDTIAEFERRTHIKVVQDFYDSNEALEAKLLVGDAGYDLVNTTTAFYGRQIRAGVYRPLDFTQLPNWKNLDPEVLRLQAQADPGNRFAVPYLHAMNGFVYSVDAVRAHLPAAPIHSLAMLFDPAVISKFANCGVSFLDSPEDILELALLYLHLDPNSRKPEDLHAAERTILAVRPYIREFDSIDYWQQLASGDLCIAVAWSSDYSVAQRRARETGSGAHLAFTVPQEGAAITYNAWLIPASAPHPQAALRFLDYLLEPKVIAAITNDIHYGNDNLAARRFVEESTLNDPAIYPTPEIAKRLYLPAAVDPEFERLRTRTWTRIKTGE